MSKTKVLLLTVRADHGGGPSHVNLLINNISSDFDLYVACPDDKPYFKLWQNNCAVKDIFMLPHRKFGIGYLKKLSAFIKTNEITLVHSHGKGAGVYARLLKLLNSRLKVVHTFHGVHTMEYGTVAKNLYYLYEKLMKKLTDKFINVSYGERDICLAHGFIEAKKQVTIYNGVPDLSDIKFSHQESASAKFKVITISRFDYSKHMQLAYEIAKKLRYNTNIEFVWVGDGEDKAELEQAARKESLSNIVFTGFTGNPENYLKNANLYLSTSRWEGLPLALIEAASLSLPIVATNVTGNNEVVKDGYNGYLYEANNLENAVAQITALANNPSLYLQFAKNSRKTYLEVFTVTDMIRKTENVYLN